MNATSMILESVFTNKTQTISQKALLLTLGTLLLAFVSQLSIPLQPVPLTFQSVTVVFIGLIFGPRLAMAIVGSYLVSGLCGLPVFANGSFGLQTLMGPTGGYLLGFLPAAGLSGSLVEKGWAKNIVTSFFAGLLGASVIFILGYIWLAQYIGWYAAYLVGVKVFIVTEMVKLLVTAAVTPHFWRKAN